MQRSERAYLEDMAQACLHLRDLTQGVAKDGYLANAMLRWAVERQFTILGEALYQLRAHFPDVADTIPESRRIINFRHVLIHGYAQIEDEVVWGIIEANLKPLSKRIASLLG